MSSKNIFIVAASYVDTKVKETKDHRVHVDRVDVEDALIWQSY